VSRGEGRKAGSGREIDGLEGKISRLEAKVKAATSGTTAPIRRTPKRLAPTREAGGSGCFDHLSGFQATRTSLNALNAAADERTDRLQIRLETTASPVICVANPIAKLRTFAAYITAP